MDKNSGRFHVSLPIISKSLANWEKKTSRSAKFKGKLEWVSNKHGVIYDWKIKLDYIELDLYTTLAWFTNNCNPFNIRKKLFKELEMKQCPRPSKTSNKLVILNKNQIKIVNDFFNNRQKYTSTIKNIVAILKGNNPGGEVKNPSSAEMIIDSIKNLKYKNFVILIDDLVMKKRDVYNENYDPYDVYEEYYQFSDPISFEEFCQLNPHLEIVFNWFQTSMTQEKYKRYLQGIKEFYKKYNSAIDIITKKCNLARSKYSNNVDKLLEIIENYNGHLPFGIPRDKLQKCHIEDVHHLKDLAIYAYRENKSYKEYIERIADPNNFIPLPEDIHRKFDKNYFTYDTNGHAYPIKIPEGEKFLNEYKDMQQYKQIPKDFLTKERIAYIKRRMEYINNFHLQSH